MYTKKQAARFAISGLLVTAIHVLLATSFIKIIRPEPPLANSFAFILATSISYFINTRWSFSCTLHFKNFLRFLIVSCSGLILTVIVSGLAQYYKLHYWYGIILVVCTVPPMTFLLHKFWTYR